MEVKARINPDAVRMMKKMYGIDMEQTQYSKLITDIPKPDVVIFIRQARKTLSFNYGDIRAF